MPSQTYVLKFRADGSVEVTKQVRNIGKASRQTETQAKSLQATMGGLAKVAGLLATYFGAKQIIQTADAYTGLTNKLRIVSDSEEQLLRVRTALARVSKDTFSDIETNATLYQRLTLANKNLQASERDRVKFTKTVSQALAISGATAQETRSVLIQLSQGLGSVAVRGEEFRAVIESAPRLVKALGDATGKTVGELKEMTAQGQFLSRDFFEAILSQSQKVEEDFAKINATVSLAGAVFKTQFTVMIGQINDATGLIPKLSGLVIKLAENLDKVAVIAGGIAMIAFVQWAKNVTFSLKAINVQLLATTKLLLKIAVLTGAVWTLVEAWRTFLADTKNGQFLLVRLGEQLELLQARKEGNFGFGMTPDELEVYNKKLQNIRDTYSQLIWEIDNTEIDDSPFGDKLLENMQETAEKIRTVFSGVLGDLDSPAPVEVVKEPPEGNFWDRWREGWGQFKTDFKDGMDELYTAGDRFGAVMAETVGESIKGVSDEFAELAVEGKADFSSMAKSIVKDFISMIIQAQIYRAVSAIGGAYGVDFAKWGGPTQAGATGFQAQFGGMARAGQPVVVGEQRPEIFVPPTAGRILPYPQQAQEQQPIRIVNAVQGDSILQQASDSVVDRIVVNAINRNSSTLRGALV